MSTSASITINGKSSNPPRSFFDVSIQANFGANIQANINTEEFTFILDEYSEIIEWIENGKKSGVGIFEGIPIKINTTDGVSVIEAFNGIIDLQDNLQIFPNLGEIKAKLRQDNGLNQLQELIEPLDYGYLRSLGVIKPSDYNSVDYVVVRPDATLESITILITAYLLSKQLKDTIKELAESVATVAGIAASGLSGPIGAAIYAVAVAIAQAIYAAAILILLINLATDLFNLIIQPKRTHKCISFYKLLQKTCEYIGLRFNSTIEELNSYYYLPSNINTDDREGTIFIKKYATITEGIPNVRDFGYSCPEMFQLVRDVFEGRFAIIDDTVQFHSENSDYWIKESGYVKPDAKSDVRGSSFRYNTDEMISSYLIQFQTDIADSYTIENYQGTSYQVLTDAKTVNEAKNKTIKNAKQLTLPIALGNRKDTLNGFEKLAASLAGIVDEITKVFGGGSNFKKKIKNREGLLKVADNNHNIPKLLYLEGSTIPKNHREKLSAKVLWDKFHNYNSFVDNNFGKQRRVIVGERIPFGFPDYQKVTRNSYFKDENGKQGKIMKLEWVFNRDYAVIDYWLPEVYTNNLTETKIEPS
jgi:hypothetical protein